MISLKEVVGGGYNDFWNFKGRYRVCKGSRASKKSKTAALWFIVNLMKYDKANLLVVRKTFRTLKDSCFTELKWAIWRLGVQDYWHITISPLEITYKPTGQKIYFRGLDDPLKITSISVDKGVLCWMWLEEAYEITREADFDMLDESIRGEVPPGLFKQITITLNPWNQSHWIKARFFDVESPDILAKTTNYLCNEWLDKADLEVFERMKRQNPQRYKVAGLGQWGISEGLVFERFKEEDFDLKEIRKIPDIRSCFGLDFGYTNDPTALFCGLADEVNKRLYVFDELYQKSLTNEELARKIILMGYGREKIRADCSEPKSIDRLGELGLDKICPARKGKDSINNGIDFLRGFEIIIHPRCSFFLTEIENYSWDKDKMGNFINKPCDSFNHLMDAMRYAVEDLIKGDSFSFD